jgi:hypothetical protein
MAFSLACDTGKTTLRIEGIDGDVTFNDVANAGAGSVAVDGGGTEDPSFFVTEHVANDLYQILKNIQFGDGTNALTFYSKNEMVYFDDDQTFTIKSNATLQLGEIAGDYCINGASWSWEEGGDIIASGETTAICYIYDSRIHYRGTGRLGFIDGTIDFRNSIFSNFARTGSNSFYIAATVDNVILKNIYFSNWRQFALYNSPDTCEGLWIHYTDYALWFNVSAATLFEPGVTDEGLFQVRVAGIDQTIILKNPQFTLLQNKLNILQATSKIVSQFTCDIHVVDKDGANLQGVTVLCEDEADSQVFSVSTGADGKIAQQTITYKKWEGTAETETEYSPHKFTFSKNGYTLLVMKNVTVDARINWDVEVKFPERIRARMANPGRLAILR